MTNLKELGKVQIGRSGKYPSKKTINLMYHEHDTQDRVFTIVLFVLFMIFLYFFSRYGVAAQLARADAAEANYSRMEQNLEKMKEANSQYASVRADYSHYGNGYLNDEELSRQDRVTMLNVIDERVHAAGGIQTIQIQDNIAVITVGVTDAQRLPDIILSLEGSEYVSYVTAQTAATDEDRDKLSLSEDGTPDQPLFVTGQLTIYFRTPEEVRAALASGEASATSDQALDAGENGSATGQNAYIPSIQHTRPDQIGETEAASSTTTTTASANAGDRNTSAEAAQAKAERAAAQRAAEEAAKRQAAQAAQAAAQQPTAAVPQTVAVQQQPANIDTPTDNPFTGGSITIQGGSPLG